MRKGLNMSLADAEAHQHKHGFRPLSEKGREILDVLKKNALKGRKSPQMNKTEAEFGRILEAQKQRGEIVEYRHQGIRLSWGIDPGTEKPMWYTPDFYVVESAEKLLLGKAISPDRGIFWTLGIKIIEIKSGARASKTDKDRGRFRGCRACWPMFQFELWEKKAGQWKRIE
jgi:hypothetical protein